jgi:beta-phosphoglucomutase-like phosphatase (HAD superfamily)
MEFIKKKIKAVIFDMDDTIIKTGHIWEQVTLLTLKKCGIINFSEEGQKTIESLASIGCLTGVATAIKKGFNLPNSVEFICNLKTKIAGELFKSKVEFVEGFESFHNNLCFYNIPSGIATNAPPDNLREIVKIMNLDAKFGNNIYSIANVNFKPKPDPAIFLHAAQKLSASPSECVIFEDSICGFNAAKAAGIKCIAIKNNRNMHLVDQVDYAINNYDEAIEVLREI